MTKTLKVERIPVRTIAVIPHLIKKKMRPVNHRPMLISQSVKIHKNSMMKKSRVSNRMTSMKKKNWFQSVSSSTLLLNIQTQLMTSSCTGEYRKKISVSGPPQMTDTYQRTQSGSVIRLHARRSSTKILRAQHLGLFTSTFNGKRRWNQQLNQLVLCSWNRKKMRGITMVVKTIKYPLTCQ